MKIIPAIDLLEGKCVRLLKGNYNNVSVFHDEPAVFARELDNAGFENLHLVDLDGARGSGDNRRVLYQITQNTKLRVDFGGGLRTLDDVKQAFDYGAVKINIGSMALKNRELFEKVLSDYGDNVVWNADLKNKQLVAQGWQERVEDDFDDLIEQFQSLGLKNILTTDVEKDGTLQGPNFDLYRHLMKNHPDINWIASGGISRTDDLIQLKTDGLFGAVVGQAMYKGTITFEELLTLQNAD